MKISTLIAVVCAIAMLMSCGEEKPVNNQPKAKTVVNKIDNSKTPVTNSEDDNDNIGSEPTISDQAEQNTEKPKVNANVKKTKPAVRAKSGGFAEITFNRMRYNFGTIEEGDEITHTFTFFNTGTGDLIISDATATCGCTRPDFPFTPTAPQGSGVINVTFNSTGKRGPQNKPITVISNATDKRMTVYLIGEVVPKGSLNKKEDVQVEPDSADSN